MSDATKALARRVFSEMWNRHDLSVLDELFAEDYLAHVASAPEAIDGIERLRRLMAMFQVILPDLQFTVEDQIAEGDKVVTRWTARGTASEAPGDTPLSSGEPITLAGSSIHRVAEGKLVEGWDNWDALTALQAEGSDVFDSLSFSL